MTKISKRLLTITDFVDKSDSIVDVGCDHGLLSIYIYENKLAKKIIASDINEKALSSAIKNIEKRQLKIMTIVSDGIKDIDMKGINTLIISGMGTGTVLHILEDDDKLKKVKKIIVQSNNDHQKLREEMNKKGYFLENEVYTLDKGKWYITCLFVKKNEKNDEITLKYGMLDNQSYNDYLMMSYKKIYKNIPISSFKQKNNFRKKIKELKKALLSK